MVIGPIQFDTPAWLAFIPVLWIVVVLIGRRSLSGLGGVTRWSALIIRLLVVTTLGAALADPHLRREGEGVSLMLVVDGSASMPREALQSLPDYLGEPLSRAQPGDRLGLVTTAKDAYARVLPRDNVPPAQALRRAAESGDLDPGVRTGTALDEAIQMALTIKPADTAGRILLVSDGNETSGSLLRAAERAQATGIPVDVLAVDRGVGGEVVFDSLVAPATARQGQTVNLVATLRSTRATSGRLSLFVNDRPYDLDPGSDSNAAQIGVRAGVEPVTIPVELTRGGPQRFEAIFEPDEPSADAVAQNNYAQGVTFVESEGMILLVSTDVAASAPLLEALTSAELDVETRSPLRAFDTFQQLQAYDAVILFDIPASDFNGRQMDQLTQYVRDSGGGLVMVGGPDSFGAGGWIGTPVAEVLPVRLDVPERREMPKGALAIVIDASGSMGMRIGGTSLTQLDAAAEGAVAAINALSRLDLATVIRFDSTTRVVVPMIQVSDKQAIARRVRRLGAGGGTIMFPAVRQAIRSLMEADAAVRHIVILSDGQTGDRGEWVSVVQEANERDISISTIAIGDGADTQLLSTLATQTEGTFHPVSANAGGLAQLTQIFIKEAQVIKRSLIWEGEPFTPAATGAPSIPLRGIPTPVPPISGYIVTTDREGLSVVTLRGPQPENDPILAHWQAGLGRVVAFTSDATTRWSSSWVDWSPYDAFWEQHVRWVMRPAGSNSISVVTTNDGPRTRVVVNALDQAGEPLNFANFVSRTVGPDGESGELSLPQTAPGRYEGTFDSSAAGSHTIAIRYEATVDGNPERGTVLAAVTRPFADEFRAIESNPALLRRVADVTGGRYFETGIGATSDLFSREGLTAPVALRPIWLIVTLMAITLFLADVAVRRVRIDIPAMARVVRRAFKREQQKASQIDALRAAREKASSRLERAKPTVETKTTRSIKFEADPASARQPGDVVTAAPPRERPATSNGATSANPAEEEEGMSRLMRAKKRALEQRASDSDH